MPTIKFERVERDCGANETARKEAQKDGSTPRLIYDFEVLIDGEKRAVMSRTYSGKGYTVQDVDGRPVAPPLPHYHTGREVDSKAEFLTIVSELLDAGKIPTLAQLVEKRTAEAQAKTDKIALAKEKQRQHAMGRHAAALYDALKAAVEALRSGAGPEEKMNADRDGRAVLNAIDTQAAEWIAKVAADPGMFGIY